MKSFLPAKIKSSTSLCLSDWSISYIDNIDDDKNYYHKCYKQIVSLDNTFTCMVDGEILTNLKGLIINTTIPHSFIAGNTQFMITLIKTSSVYGKQLDIMLNNQAYKNISLSHGLFQYIPLFPHHYLNDLSNMN